MYDSALLKRWFCKEHSNATWNFCKSQFLTFLDESKNFLMPFEWTLLAKQDLFKTGSGTALAKLVLMGVHELKVYSNSKNNFYLF